MKKNATATTATTSTTNDTPVVDINANGTNVNGEQKQDEPAGDTATDEPKSEEPANDEPQGEGEGDQKSPETTTEETSEKLLSIRAEIDTTMDAIPLEKDRTKRLKLVEKIGKLQDDEKAEINAIKKAIADRQLQEKRNQRIALVDDLLGAAFAEAEYRKIFDATPDVEKADEPGVFVKPADVLEQMNALTNAAKNAREIVVNELLAKVGVKSSTPTTTPSGEGSEPKGEKGEKIVELYLANRTNGMKESDNIKAIINEGFARGTVGAVTLAYRQKHGLDPIK